MGYEYEEWISIAIDEKLAWRGFDPDEETRARDELEEVYAKAKMYDEHTCGEPIDVNINITLTKKSLEELEHKDFKQTVKAKLNNKGGLL
ncbi:hypothetical protein [Mammaliicoccus sciuri]|uniref:hypothetical protein n=1 Tax=Mammaliicoccus sciuri TaxID=1296 RepID=UPI003F561E77